MESQSLKRSVNEFGTAITKAGASPDRVELTSAAVARRRDIPDRVRDDLVERVRDQIQSGTYDSNEKLDSALNAVLAEMADMPLDTVEVNHGGLLEFLASHPDTPVIRVSARVPDSPQIGEQFAQAVQAFFAHVVGEPFDSLVVQVHPDIPPQDATHGGGSRE